MKRYFVTLFYTWFPLFRVTVDGDHVEPKDEVKEIDGVVLPVGKRWKPVRKNARRKVDEAAHTRWQGIPARRN